MAKSATFTVDSQLLLELGERLVANRSVALAELVKNAYDADATSCTITLENASKPGGRIIIEDSGNGMSFSAFERAWMRIATTDSTARPNSPRYHRPRTGAKGIGRFACRVLSNRLILETTARDDSDKRERPSERMKRKIAATFDWNKFSPGSDVTTIPIGYDVTILPSATKTGTKIILDDTRGSWTAQDVEDLRRDIVTLVSPFPVSKGESTSDPGFQIILKAPEYGKDERNLREDLLRSATAVLEAELNVPGQPFYTIKFKGERLPITFAPDIKFGDIGPARLKIHFFVYDKQHFANVEISVTDARELGRTQGGVRIYQNGFRVFKYGDPRDDWLDLDSDRGRRITTFSLLPDELSEGLRRPALSLPGNNQLFGVVEISRFDNPNLILNVTRDRLFENEAFKQLRAFVRLGIDWMTVEYARRGKKNAASSKLTQQDVTQTEQTVTERLDSIQREVTDPAVKQEVQSVTEDVQRTFTALKESIDKMAMLEVLASSGGMIFVFEHEVARLVSDLREIAGGLSQEGRKTRIDKKVIRNTAGEIDQLADNINDLGEHIGLLTGVESRSKRKAIAIAEMVDLLIKPFRRNLREYAIEFSTEIRPDLRTPKMFQCEFASILLNLFSNSIKAVKQETSRRILMRAFARSSTLTIEFLDTGPGVPKEIRERVFEPFQTYSQPDPVFGAGTGLGLTIVRDLVSQYSGEVGFVDPPANWSTCLRITLPVGNGD